MASSNAYKVAKRRKREGKTNYRKRLTLLSSHKPRLVVRKSNKNILAQMIEYKPEGDRTLASASSKDLKRLGYSGHTGNAKSGYLVGYLCGKRCLKKKLKTAVPDIGMVSPVNGSCVFSVILGAVDAGLELPHSKDVLPSKKKVTEGLEGIIKKIDGE